MKTKFTNTMNVKMKNHKAIKYPILLFFTVIGFIACKKSTTGASQVTPPVVVTPKDTSSLLSISQALNLGSPKISLNPDTIYSSFPFNDGLFRPLPGGFEDKIMSFHLPKGYMAVFAENSNGTGQSACFVAVDSAINANLPFRLRNNISYIRYIPINNPNKNGIADLHDAVVNAFGFQWFYGWSLNRSSFTGQQFVPMTWGKGSCTDTNIKYLIDRNDIDHLLSFNEPDNTTQSNVPVDTAIARYTIMQKTGLRLGSPATTQYQAVGQYTWLGQFMAKAASLNLRIDFIPIHWYDWGNQTDSSSTDSLTAVGVFNRFTKYVQSVHAAYPGIPIWITEFNANVNRTSTPVHEYFMKFATDWLNNSAQSYVERYSYFFEANHPATNTDNTLTNIGQFWKNLSSVKSFSGNIISDAVTIK
ncbi:MAG: hypothetical protein KGO81_13785 [Bacteroidota bacterium]|nr:hypothetical protein [Bacteroidota bacterium]